MKVLIPVAALLVSGVAFSAPDPRQPAQRPAALHTRTPTPRPTANPVASRPPRVARGIPATEAERLLEEGKIELIAAKVVAGLAAKFGELSSQRTATSAESARAADSLKREIAQYRKEVKDLSDHMKNLSEYTREIERSLSGIDANLSTPSVLTKKLEQQQNGLKP